MKLTLTACSPLIKPADIKFNIEQVKQIISDESYSNSDIILFPLLNITASSCGNIMKNNLFLSEARTALLQLKNMTRGKKTLFFVSIPSKIEKNYYKTVAAIRDGSILKEFNIHSLPDYNIEHYENFYLEFNNLRLFISPVNPLQLIKSRIINRIKADIILFSTDLPASIGSSEQLSECCRQISQHTGSPVMLSNTGGLESTSRFVYKGCCGIFYNNKKSISFQKRIEAVSITDSIILEPFEKREIKLSEESISIVKNPFLPNKNNKKILDEYYELQTRSLAVRLANTRIEKILIGLSGGLDSTLALLVSAEAMDWLSLPRENIIAVSMPGFGTTDKTNNNAKKLADGIKAGFKEIPIKESVLKHFEDIGFDPELKNTTYENAQARERAQILLDLANMHAGLVVGTGNLSESALGWTTFGGDQIANFNLNISVPKTVIRSLVAYLAENNKFENISEVLLDVVNTPISPELLPSDKSGNIRQQTEDIIGPYELHDFFLYYFIKHNFSPDELLESAVKVFADRFTSEYIEKTLKIFLSRFFASQFKRSCAPDGAIISDVSLSPAVFFMPSDSSAELFIENLK